MAGMENIETTVREGDLATLGAVDFQLVCGLPSGQQFAGFVADGVFGEQFQDVMRRGRVSADMADRDAARRRAL
jgi:hypothetical protein